MLFKRIYNKKKLFFFVFTNSCFVILLTMQFSLNLIVLNVTINFSDIKKNIPHLLEDIKLIQRLFRNTLSKDTIHKPNSKQNIIFSFHPSMNMISLNYLNTILNSIFFKTQANCFNIRNKLSLCNNYHIIFICC